MNEKLRESLSAVLDGEANELELERVLSQMDDESDLRKTWMRYSAIRSVNTEGISPDMAMDISKGVRRAILQGAPVVSQATSTVQRLLKPLASFAVAASVAATVVLGGQQLAQIGDVNTSYQGSLAASSPVGLINTVGATAIQASYGTQSVPVLQPTARTAYRELARQRMNVYMQEHVEHAALNSPQGLVPFSRVQQIKE
ncbi:MAG: sigma-E factor negative regulatory protein RseA [Halioglobus sp.]|jgi:sigma-E factor negative regulatory protein RseA